MNKRIEVTGTLCLNEQDPYEPTGLLLFDPIDSSENYYSVAIPTKIFRENRYVDIADLIEKVFEITPNYQWNPIDGKKVKITIELL